jgi:N-acyl-D-aspartate/D-glutamate deacylase
MSVAADRPLNWNLLNVNTLLWEGSRQRLGAGDHAAGRGGRVVALTMPISSTLRVNLVSGFILDTFDGWTDLFALPLEERARQLRDPARRAAMRAGVEDVDTTLTRRMRDWSALVVAQTFTEATRAHEGRTLGAICADDGGDPFERLLDIVLADDLRTVIVLPPIGNDPESWRLRSQVWRDPRAVIGGSDAGAHLDMIDTFVYATSLLGPIVRDGHLSLPEAVRALTDVPARLYGIRERGRVAEGWRADLVVFDPATVGPGTVQLRADLPAGSSRLYAEPTGVAHVVVNGEEIVRDGTPTGATPGTVLRSGRDTETVHAASPFTR